MAKNWLLEPGESSGGEPVADKPLDFCFTVLGLRQRNLIGATKTEPISGGSYAIVEITTEDQRSQQPGLGNWFLPAPYRRNRNQKALKSLKA